MTRTRTTEVAIIGAGFAGIAAAKALRAAGHHSVMVIERADRVGGTWRDNTYPGVACDVPSHLYGFADLPNPQWSRVFAPGAEIQRYLEAAVDSFGVGDHLLLQHEVDSARWDESTETWSLELTGPELSGVTAEVVVLACGRLTEPTIPDVPGLETFPGPLFHSARWDHRVDLTGARVALIGTGASAVQILPELVDQAATVTLFQRSAAWIVPRGDAAYTADQRERFATDPDDLRRLRTELFHEGEARFAARAGDAAESARAEAAARAHLNAQVRDPDLRRVLTPDYAFGCKRVLLSDDFYPAVSAENVTVVPAALDRMEGSRLVGADGSAVDADVVILATGFASSQQPYAHRVRGEHGTLAEHWAHGMTAFGSTVVAGFPNLFVLNGPNASLGHNSSVLMIEQQTAYLTRALGHRDGSTPLRVDPAAEQQYTAMIDAAAAPTTWLTGGCHNWYVDERSGRLTLLWPGTAQSFADWLGSTDGSEFLSTDTHVAGAGLALTPRSPQ